MIDVDQGQSGASAADREGFQRLVADVSLGKAGIVLGLECSRLARNNADWHRLLEICALTDTLICDEDGLYDPGRVQRPAAARPQGHDERGRAALHPRPPAGRAARQGRAAASCACALPVGLVYDPAGNVVLDPDAGVRHAIAPPVRDASSATGSASAVVKAFAADELTFPGRHAPAARTPASCTGSRCATTRCCSRCTTRATPAPTSTADAASVTDLDGHDPHRAASRATSGPC